MDSAEAVAAKRKMLIDALMMCLQKSRVVQVVDGKTVRSVIDSASAELWREGEFRLDPVWKLLVAQPGLTAEEVAPPLLVFKAFENELGVQVRIPQALSAIPRGEQVRLREALGVQRADFAKAIDELKQLASEEQQSRVMAEIVDKASSRVDAPSAASKPPTGRQAQVATKQRKLTAIALAALALVALGGSIWLATRDASSDFDVKDVSALQLANARREGPAVTATITDPKWSSLARDDKKKAVSAVMDVEAPKGVRSLDLRDGNGGTAATVDDTPDGRVITVQ